MKTSEGISVSGRIIIRSYPAGTLHCYETLVKMGKLGLARELLEDGKVEIDQKNLVVDSSNYGKDILVQYLISAFNGSNPFPLGIAWGEIGTGSTAPATGDIALTTPTNRAAVAYASDISFNKAQLQFFFPDSILANGTYNECGSFIGGTSTIGTGNMFNHALFSSPYTKSAGVDSTLEIDISFS